MKRSRFSEERVIYALRQHEAGTSATDVCRQLGVSEATFYQWKEKYARGGRLPRWTLGPDAGCGAAQAHRRDEVGSETLSEHGAAGQTPSARRTGHGLRGGSGHRQIKSAQDSLHYLTELRELRQLREENSRLKRLVADLTLDKHILTDSIFAGQVGSDAGPDGASC